MKQRHDPAEPWQARHAPFALRLATAGDVAQLVALENASFDSERLSPRSFRHFVRSASADLIVATRKDQVCGYALVLYRRGTSVARVYSIAVAEDMRGHGLGEALMNECEEQSRRRDALFLRLEVRPDNAVAIRFYERLGYRAFGRILDYYEDHADALRLEKSLVAQAPKSARQVPYYAQTTEFTCGPAAMMMAMAGLGEKASFSRREEIRLWREATIVFMTSGLGGCEPVGMALALARRGLRPTVYLNEKGPLFLDSVRSDWKREVMTLVQQDFREEARRRGLRIHYAPLNLERFKKALKSGAVAIVLISAYRMYHERFPHWVVAYDCDDKMIFAHDPWVDPEAYETPMAKAALAIPEGEFDRMMSYGKSRLRAAILVERKDTQ